MRVEYLFKEGKVVHVLVLKPSENIKLGFGFMLHTYHFSENQISSGSLLDDSHCCFDCPYSFNQNNGKSGGCYTHRAFQGLGLMSMLKRLKKKKTFENFKKEDFNKFLSIAKSVGVGLARFGVYGEPVTLPLNVVGKIVRASNKHTGYTHQWHKAKGYNKYFMASVSSNIEAAVANAMGYRSFISYKDADTKGATCPAAKEFKGNKKTCIECAACGGGKGGNIKIKNH